MAKSRAPRPVTIRAPSGTVGPRTQPGSTLSIPSSTSPPPPGFPFPVRDSCTRTTVPPVFSSATPTPAATHAACTANAAPGPKAPRQPVSLNATRNSQFVSIPGAQHVEPARNPMSSRVWPVVRLVKGTDGTDPREPISRTSISGWRIRRSRASVCLHGTRLSPRLHTRSKGARGHSFRAAGFAGRRVFVSPAGHSEAYSHGGVIGCGRADGLDAGGVPSRTRRPHGGF
jgi:hypothetical protein